MDAASIFGFVYGVLFISAMSYCLLNAFLEAYYYNYNNYEPTDHTFDTDGEE